MKNVRLTEPILFLVLLGVGVGTAQFGSGYQAQTLFQMAMMTLLAIGWNVISGFTGYVSFGQVAFFGLGAYVAAVSILNFDVPWYGAAVIAALGAGILALPLGLIMLRLNGIFFALGMFGLARILQLIANSLDVTGGPMGTTVPVADSPQLTATVAVVAVAIGLLLSYFLSRSRIGLTLMATRDDPVAAEAAGVNTWKSKVAAFCISGCVAAVAGSLYVWNVGYLDPNSAFAGAIELQTVLMVLAGGIGTVWGPVVGGILISLLSTFLWARFPMEQQIILGVLIMFIAIVTPGGLLGELFKRGWLKRPPIWGPPPAALVRTADKEIPKAGQEVLLTCHKLGVRFGGVRALEGVDVEVRSGEMLAIIGPNGAGKSSLFNLMSAFHRPTAGDVKLLGQSILGRKRYQLARGGIARTFQTSRLFSSLTVWETVLVAASSVCPRRADAVARTTQILRDVDLLQNWSDMPDILPPGRQRLLEIARALALDPRVLLLDEAMAGMTAQEIGRVHEALRAAIDRGVAVVAIEHVLPAIAPLAARVQVLDFGKTIAEGIPHEVLNDPTVIEAYMGVEGAPA
ncbi:branched-chain amino acid ABC transporter ATP-binding protein/permease [Bradyrhizobium sp.]|uniref:branched-chain amino acid ABC transporter ATP-binding protein/permease n=1 Tax=Bradyrhizobium sp. TaxID=376 RepID=UPI00239ED2DC|nr:branched-chain amino acid ABC transporter ATP-binding protein/permease [Bradyrhizobium sp.]MDE1936111.1 branched-chain amino acid ABC transporter ATP-binding protein/permease [Bradyrhizobium sp.]